jgi:hypothetical protein
MPPAPDLRVPGTCMGSVIRHRAATEEAPSVARTLQRPQRAAFPWIPDEAMHRWDVNRGKQGRQRQWIIGCNRRCELLRN